MESLYVALVLFSALLHASWNALLHQSRDKLWQTGMMAVPCGLAGLAGVLLLPAPAAASWPYIGASALLELGYSLALIRAYRSGDFGRVYPVARGMSPLLVTLGAWAFGGERPGLVVAGGILMVSAGIVSLAYRRRGLAASGGMGAAVLTGCFIASYTVVDGIGVRLAGDPFAYIAWVYLLFNLPLLALVLRAGGDPRPRLADRRAVLTGMLGGVVSLCAYGLVISALRVLPMGQVSALRELSSLFGVLLGWLWLGERPTPLRVAACALMVGGVLMLRM